VSGCEKLRVTIINVRCEIVRCLVDLIEAVEANGDEQGGDEISNKGEDCWMNEGDEIESLEDVIKKEYDLLL
jgi:hypothetical protein